MELEFFSNDITGVSIPLLDSGCTLEDAFKMKISERNTVYEPVKYDEIDLKIISQDYNETLQSIKEINEEINKHQTHLDNMNTQISQYLTQQKQMLDYFKSITNVLLHNIDISALNIPIITYDTYNNLLKHCKNIEESITFSTIEWKSIHEETIRKLQSQLSIENQKMDSIRKFMKEMLSEVGEHNIERVVSKCPVCYESEPDHCFTSCGHLYCKSCSSKLNNKCSLCNKKSLSIIKIFL